MSRQYVRELVGAMPWPATLAALLTLLGGISEAIGLVALVPLLGAIGADVERGEVGQVARWTTWGLQQLGLTTSLMSVLAVYAVLVAGQALLRRWQALTYASLQTGFTSHLRKRLQRAITRADWAVILGIRASDVTNAITGQPERVGHATYALFRLGVELAMVLAYMAVTLLVAPVVTGLALALAVVLGLPVRRRLGRAALLGEGVTRAGAEAYRGVLEHLGGIKLTKSYGAEERSIRMFAGLADAVATSNHRVLTAYANSRCWFETSAAVGLGLGVLVAVKWLGLAPTTLVVLLAAFARVLPRISSAEQGTQQVLSVLPDYEAMIALERRLAVGVRDRASRAAPESGVPLRRAIRLERVSFWYPSGPPASPTLDEVDLTVEVGRTTAVVGPSGAGKSTLADLVLGLLSPTRGRILLDEVPLTPGSLGGWRAQVGYVPQDTFLFHDTVRANLLWARPDAGEAEMWEALTAAAADFVGGLPERLDTVLGDRGVRLSGGERQRLALARALLRRPAVLILDEATSNLDSENERRVQEAIDRLHGRLTIVVITHRLTTIRSADVIHVLETGRLVESGRWDSLVEEPGGRFRSLCLAQGLVA